MTNTERARAWLASSRPLLTWAPLHHGVITRRHAWLLTHTAVGGGAHGVDKRTACGIEIECPTNFSDDSRTLDCEGCRDKAAEPLAKLLDEVREEETKRAAGVVRQLSGDVNEDVGQTVTNAVRKALNWAAEKIERQELQ